MEAVEQVDQTKKKSLIFAYLFLVYAQKLLPSTYSALIFKCVPVFLGLIFSLLTGYFLLVVIGTLESVDKYAVYNIYLGLFSEKDQ